MGLSRECRYAGAGVRWWPVALHSLVVADLLPKRCRIHGLLHDSPECIIGDIPKPVKSAEVEAFEETLLRAIYKDQNIPFPTAEEQELVRQADSSALHGEVYTVGTAKLQEVYPRCEKAEQLVLKYVQEFPPMECIEPSGRCPIEFMRRFRIYRDWFESAPGSLKENGPDV